MHLSLVFPFIKPIFAEIWRSRDFDFMIFRLILQKQSDGEDDKLVEYWVKFETDQGNVAERDRTRSPRYWMVFTVEMTPYTVERISVRVNVHSMTSHVCEWRHQWDVWRPLGRKIFFNFFSILFLEMTQG